MSTVLFAFLGTGHYRPATYAFGKAAGQQAKTRFVAQAMLNVAGKSAGFEAPDRIILCGTSTSGWHALVEALQNPQLEPPAGVRTETAAVTEAELSGLAEQYSALLHVKVVCQLINFGITAKEQAEFVTMVASHVGEGDTVHFDVTHGLRHLSMLALVAALAVRTLRDATIAGVWYGAFELSQTNEGAAITGQRGFTPMVKLDGLLTISDWLAAINIFDATGSVASFAQPLRNEGRTETAKKLEAAAFAERVRATTSARDSAQYALDQLDEVVSGVAAVVRPAIEGRLVWATDASGFEAGFDHALRFVDSGNEAKAATLIYETAIELLVNVTGLKPKHEMRAKIVADACHRIKRSQTAQVANYARTYLEMKDLRNVLVHPDEYEKDRRTGGFLASPVSCQTALRRMAGILRQTPPQALIDEIKSQIKKNI
jgi:CRISPR-associated Csx2 family protein